MATVLRPPLITRTERSDPSGVAVRSEGDVWENRLLNLLKSQDKFFTVAGDAPDYDWPNPRGYIPSISLRTHTDPVKLNLLGKDTFFGAAGETKTYDYPNPPGYTPGIFLKTHTDFLKINLLNKDTFFGGAGESKTYDYPNPVITPRNISQTGYIQFVYPFNFPTIQSPFYQLHWPVPLGYIPAISLKTHADFLKLNLLGKDQFFGDFGESKTYDYPNPISPHQNRNISQTGFLGSVKINLIGQDIFFGAAGESKVYDYPNPQPPPRNISQSGFLNALKLNLLGQDIIFGAAGETKIYDYPNPIPAQRNISQLGFIQFLSPFNFPITAAPFYQLDWPNPKGKEFASDLRTYLNNLQLNLLNLDQIFGVPGQTQTYDWPNPFIPQRNSAQIAWINSLFIGDFPVIPPVIPTDVFPGAGHPVYIRRKRKDRKRFDEVIGLAIEDIYAQLTSPKMKEVFPGVRIEAGKIVQPYAVTNNKVPNENKIDWDKFTKDISHVEQLINLWKKQDFEMEEEMIILWLI